MNTYQCGIYTRVLYKYILLRNVVGLPDVVDTIRAGKNISQKRTIILDNICFCPFLFQILPNRFLTVNFI